MQRHDAPVNPLRLKPRQHLGLGPVKVAADPHRVQLAPVLRAEQ